MTIIRKGAISAKEAHQAVDGLERALEGAKSADGSVDVRKAGRAVEGKPADAVLDAVKDKFEREVYYSGGCGSSGGTRREVPDQLSKAEAKSVLTALLEAKQKVAAADTTMADGTAGKDGELSPKELVRAMTTAGGSLAGELAKAALGGVASSSVAAIIKGEKADVHELLASLSRTLGAVEGVRAPGGTTELDALMSAVKSTWPDDKVAAALLDVIADAHTKTVWVTVGSGCSSSSERREVPVDELSKAQTSALVAALKKAIDKLASAADRKGQLNEVGMLALERVLDDEGSLAAKLAGAALDEARSAIAALRPRPSYSSSSC